jgi:hypothetical protein
MKLTSVAFAIGLLATTLGCQSGNGKTVPDNLLGVWKTSDPKYADRFIEIKNDLIIFGTGGENSNFHAIVDIDQSREGKFIVYTITHLNHYGQRYKLSLYYDPFNGGTIQFKNRKHIIWTKERR